MTKRTYRSREQWLTLIEQQQHSKLSIPAFCQQNNLNLKYFYKRKGELSNQQADTSRTIANTPFIELQKPTLSVNTSGQPVATLQLRNAQLTLFTLPEPQWMAELQKALS